MKRLVAGMIVVLSVALAAPAQAAAPLAEALTGEAKTDYESAKVLYEDGDFAGAGSKFQQAYDRSKDPRLLWNVAVCEKAQRHYVRVRTLVERYLAEGKDVLAPEQVQAAKGILETIKPFIGTAKIESEEGVEIVIDGQRAGTTPLPAAVPLDLGKHQVTAQKAGAKPFATTINIEGGAESVVPVVLAELNPRARVTVNATEGDSIVFDDAVVGVTRWQGDVKAGQHTLRVTAPKHKPYELRLDLTEGSTRTVEVTLENEPRALWPYIAGGAVLVVAAVVGGYFIFKPDAKPGDQTDGTLGRAQLGFGFR